MMAAGKKKPEDENTDTFGSTPSLRDYAEEHLARSQKSSSDLKGQTPEQLIHELQVHQIELETQAEELRRAHLALEESRNKFLDLYEFAPLGYLTLNDKALITEANLACAMLLGVGRNKLIMARFRKFVTQNDSDQWVLYFMNALNGDGKQICTLMLKRVDGSVFPARLEGGRVTGSDGVITVRIALSDITDIWQIEALKESETQLRATLESTADGILAVDNEGKVLKVSRRFGEIWKIPPSILDCGNDRTLLDFVRGQLNDPDAFLKKVQALYGSDDEDMDTLTFKDGRVFERYTSPMIMDGARIGRVWSFRDVSERKRAEETLRESEERFRLLLQHVPSVSVQGYSMDGTTQYWNVASEHLYGYTAQEAVGKNLIDLVIPLEMKDDVRKAMTYMAESGQPIPAAELSLMRKDGTRVAVFSSHAIVKRSGTGTELFCIDIDLTERKRAEEALRQANKKLTLLSGITRHDINNQLTVLRGYLAILETKQPDPTLNEYFGNAATAAQRISTMIQFTKEYEKIGVNAPVWQNCRKLVDTVAKQAPLGQVMVKNDLPAGQEVFADPLIAKVFYNLMDNAVRYGGKITTLRFSVEEAGEDHLIICEDDGDGVVAGEKEKIFERGFGKNTGLGLALSREILDITGITIRETGEPGKGARFEMTVPKGAWK